jgi:hypothetical protein
MKSGDLYRLKPMAKQFPHVQALFPYMKGGEALIVKTQITKLHASKDYHIKLVDFLFDGEIYTESAQNFKEYAIYIGRK